MGTSQFPVHRNRDRNSGTGDSAIYCADCEAAAVNKDLLISGGFEQDQCRTS